MKYKILILIPALIFSLCLACDQTKNETRRILSSTLTFSLSDNASLISNKKTCQPRLDVITGAICDDVTGFRFSGADSNGCLEVQIPNIDSSYSNADSVLLWGDDIRHLFYLKSASVFEWEIELDTRPSANDLSFGIESCGLEFYFQNPDTFEAHSENWHYRDDVPGSYAVYYENNDIGGGKAFHIYRPRAWDCIGDTVWGELEIDLVNDTLTIHLPQSFLDNASYPIVIDPTFGYTSRGAIGVNLNAQNYCHLVNYGYPHDISGNMISAYICAYRNNPAAACTVSVIVYTHDSLLVNCSKVAESDKVAITKFATVPDSATWHSCPISGNLSGGQSYIVSWQGCEDCDYCLRVCADYIGVWGVGRYFDYESWDTAENLGGYSPNGYRYSVYIEYSENDANGNPYIRCRKLKRG